MSPLVCVCVCVCVCGGDFQCSPSTIMGSGFPNQVKGQVVAARSSRGTYRTRNAASTIDFYVASNELTQVIEEVTLVEGTGIKGHTPVQIEFAPRPVALKALAVRRPPDLGIERVYGPVPPPQNWVEVRRLAAEAHGAAARGGTSREVQTKLDAAYERWCQVAEVEVVDATGGDPLKWGLRGRKPKLKWASVLPETVPKGVQSPAAVATWLRGFANELTRIANLLINEAGAGFFIDPMPAGSNRPHGATFATPVRGGYGTDGRRGDGGAVRGGRPRPPTDLASCEAVAKEIAEELNAAGAKADVDDKLKAFKEELVAFAARVRVAVQQTVDCAMHDDDNLVSDAASIIERLAKIEKALEGERDKEDTQAWKDWLNSDWDKGARRAHAATKVPVQWTPTMSEVAGGGVSASPLALLDSMRNKYIRYWDATESPVECRWRGTCRPLERLSPAQLRTASLAFPRRMALTDDGWHVRHLALVSGSGLEALAVILETVEMASRWPTQVAIVTTPMLGKPRGGHRLIGKLAALYRVWSKARRPHADRWEAAHDRPFFASAAGCGPTDAVFRQAMRQEAASSSGDVAVTVLEDMEAFCETICRDGLAEEAAALGYPTCLLRASLAAHTAPRMVSLGHYVAKEVYAKRGIIAGCSFATTLVTVFYLRKLEQIAREIPSSVKLDGYIDDVALSAEGSRLRVVRDVIKAYDIMKNILTRDLGCKLAPSKANIVASDRAAGRLVARAINRTDAEAECATNLGTDVTAGGSRRRIGRTSKRRARFRNGLGRGRRLWAVSKVLGRKALRLFTSGIATSLCFGGEVWGLSHAEILRLRRTAGQAMRPRSRCRSLTAVHLINHMPTAVWEVAVVVAYAKAVWRANTRREHAAERGVALSDLRGQWQAAHDRMAPTVDAYRRSAAQGAGKADASAARRAWAEVKGPVGAMELTLARIGWHMKSAFVLGDARGDEIALTTNSPALIRFLLTEATKDAAEKVLGARWARDDPKFEGRRICPDVAIKVIRSAGNGRLSAQQLGAYRAAVCGGICTRHRAAASGYLVDDLCTHCGAEGDTVHHRVFCCPHTKAAVLELVPRWLYEEGGRASPKDGFWSTSLFPHPADDWPQPAADFSGVVLGDEGGSSGLDGWNDPVTGFGGDVYSDGSCHHSLIRGLSRAAASSVQVDASGARVRAIHLPIPRHLPQTSQAWEHVGVAVSRRMAVRTAHIRSDCANVVRAANAPLRLALSPSKMYSGIILDRYTRVGEAALAGTSVSWVKAHRAEQGDADHDTRRDVKGNASADLLAGEAVGLHPQPTHDQKVQLEYDLRRAPLVARAIGAALAMFPAAEEQRMLRRPRPADAEAAAAADQHIWQFGYGLWRCDKCGTWARGDSLTSRQCADKCPGHIAHRCADNWARQGHKMAMVSGVAPFAFCTRCGAWGNRRARNLRRPCNGPTPSGAAALARIAKGKHPWRKKLPGGGEAQRANIVVVSGFDKAAGAWKNLGQHRGSAKRRVGARAGNDPAAATAAAVEAVEADGVAEVAVGGSGPPQAVTVDAHMEHLIGAAVEEAIQSDEDPFGHGGNLDQVEPSSSGGNGDSSGAERHAGATGADIRAAGEAAVPTTRAHSCRSDVVGGAKRPAEVTNADTAASGGGQTMEPLGVSAACDVYVAARAAARLGGHGARHRLDEVKRRVRLRIVGACNAQSEAAAQPADASIASRASQLEGTSGPTAAAGPRDDRMDAIDGPWTLRKRGSEGGHTDDARRQMHHSPDPAAVQGLGDLEPLRCRHEEVASAADLAMGSGAANISPRGGDGCKRRRTNGDSGAMDIADVDPAADRQDGSGPPRGACGQMHHVLEPALPGRGLRTAEPPQRPLGGDVGGQLRVHGGDDGGHGPRGYPRSKSGGAEAGDDAVVVAEVRLAAQSTSRIASGPDSPIGDGVSGYSQTCVRAGSHGHHHLSSSYSHHLSGHQEHGVDPQARQARQDGPSSRDSWGSGSRCSPVPAKARPPSLGDKVRGEVANLVGVYPPSVLHGLTSSDLTLQAHARHAVGLEERVENLAASRGPHVAVGTGADGNGARGDEAALGARGDQGIRWRRRGDGEDAEFDVPLNREELVRHQPEDDRVLLTARGCPNGLHAAPPVAQGGHEDAPRAGRIQPHASGEVVRNEGTSEQDNSRYPEDRPRGSSVPTFFQHPTFSTSTFSARKDGDGAQRRRGGATPADSA